MQGRTMWLGVGAAALMWVWGCASTGSEPNEPRPRDGIAEYREVSTEAGAAVRAALSALARVSAQSGRCGPEILAAFSAEVQRLQVDSIQLRARAQAMQARGDAYFENWHEHLARVKDPEVRAIANERRPLFQEHFTEIKRLSQEARVAFDAFASNLRKARNALEADPGSLDAAPTQEWLAMAKQSGECLQECLAGIIRELDSMRELLPAFRSGVKRQ